MKIMGIVVADNSSIVPGVNYVVNICHAVFNHIANIILPYINFNNSPSSFWMDRELFCNHFFEFCFSCFATPHANNIIRLISNCKAVYANGVKFCDVRWGTFSTLKRYFFKIEKCSKRMSPFTHSTFIQGHVTGKGIPGDGGRNDDRYAF